MSEAINEYEQERRQKREKLRELGIDPYGQREAGITPLANIKSQYTPEMGHDGGPVVKAAGRIVLKRDMGKLSFLSLRDETGDLQVALDKKRLDDTAWKINDLLDLGDQIIVEGPLGVTKKGEITIWATGLKMASKSVLPPPGKWDGLSDIELRYRQRYVDLWANPEVMKVLKLRMAVVAEVRAYLSERGFIEVETPMMQPMAGGAAARPFVTHHNALDIPLYMRIAPELYLKRLLVGGFSKVFELNRNFRNEGISPRHNPEFTMLELYEAYGSWETMADLVEGMICHIAEKLFGSLQILQRDNAGRLWRAIDLTRPWPRVSMADLVEEKTGWKFDKELAPLDVIQKAVDHYRLLRLHSAARKVAQIHQGVAHRIIATTTIEQCRLDLAELRKLEKAEYAEVKAGLEASPHDDAELERKERQFLAWIDLDEALDEIDYDDQRAEAKTKDFFYKISKMSPAEQLVEMYEKLIEPTLINPTFVTKVPSVIIPLAKKNKDDPFFADVYELAINGQEISPGYSELNDPDVQAANFAHQVGDEAEKQKTDEDFLTALKYGMPPAGGLGLGIDRLVMMLTGAESIRDVILFPLMRPQG
jgi:lysyl-tRNA synthetase class 2